MPDPAIVNRIHRALTLGAGLARPVRPRWLTWLCGLVALGLALQSLVGFASPNPAWPLGVVGPHSFSEALELDDDEPQFNLAPPAAIIPAFQLAPAPALLHLTTPALTPLTPPPPFA